MALAALLPKAGKAANAYLLAAGDALVGAGLTWLGGGPATPLFLLLLAVVGSQAIRAGYGPGLLAGAIGIAASQLAATLLPQAPLLVVAALAGAAGGQRSERAERDLVTRLTQSDALNAATTRLTALEFDPLLDALVSGASQLFGGAAVYLKPSPGLRDYNDQRSGLACFPGQPAPELVAQLRDLAETSAASPRPDEPSRVQTLPNGQRALVLTIALAGRGATLASLVLADAEGGPLRTPADEVTRLFVERAAVALENASLYYHLARRGDDLRRAYADLAAAHEELVHVDENKTNFLANVSHEVRTPLTSIRSFSELLLTYEDVTDIQREFLTIINAESERLTRMVSDVLEITKIESGTVDWRMERLDPAELLNEAARVQRPLVETRNLQFIQEVPEALPPIFGDRDRLLQVVTNLISNALKFTERGSITLRAQPIGDELEVAVLDTGIGIAAEDRERIFEKFQQIGATPGEKPRGTGLGLSICREIVEHHDGRIWVESALGEGSCFAFAIPLVKERAAAPAS